MTPNANNVAATLLFMAYFFHVLTQTFESYQEPPDSTNSPSTAEPVHSTAIKALKITTLILAALAAVAFFVAGALSFAASKKQGLAVVLDDKKKELALQCFGLAVAISLMPSGAEAVGSEGNNEKLFFIVSSVVLVLAALAAAVFGTG